MNLNKIRLKYTIIGLVIGTLAFPLTNLVNANPADFIQPVNADYYLDGLLLKIGNNDYNYNYNENSVPTTLSYKKVLYCPVDLMAKVLGKNFYYNANLKRIYITQNSNTNSIEPVFMSDILKPDSFDCKYLINSSMKINSIPYTKGYMVTLNSLLDYSNLSFSINKKYTELTGFIGLNDGKAGSVMLNIISDNHTVYSKNITSNSPLQPISINLKNVRNLTFKFMGKPYGPSIDLINLMIK